MADGLEDGACYCVVVGTYENEQDLLVLIETRDAFESITHPTSTKYNPNPPPPPDPPRRALRALQGMSSASRRTMRASGTPSRRRTR